MLASTRGVQAHDDRRPRRRDVPEGSARARDHGVRRERARDQARGRRPPPLSRRAGRAVLRPQGPRGVRPARRPSRAATGRAAPRRVDDTTALHESGARRPRDAGRGGERRLRRTRRRAGEPKSLSPGRRRGLMETLAELQERRAFELRLTPDRALETLDEAEEFLRDRGLLTRTQQSALPSLYEAFHEDPYMPSSAGFGQWPRTKWPWFGELADREGVYALKIHRGKHILVTDRIAALLDPILRSETQRMAATEEDDWRLILDHLAQVGPSEVEDLQNELGLSARAMKAARAPLERCGAIVSRSLAVSATAEGPHPHTTELARWDQVYPEPSKTGGLGDLTVAAVPAAVVTPDRQVTRWLSWSWLYAK